MLSRVAHPCSPRDICHQLGAVLAVTVSSALAGTRTFRDAGSPHDRTWRPANLQLESRIEYPSTAGCSSANIDPRWLLLAGRGEVPQGCPLLSSETLW